MRRKNWFEHKEEGVGYKRLLVTKYLYKFFGAFPLRIIAFFVCCSIFILSGERRKASINFFKTIGETNVIYKSFKQFLNYANSLVDRIISFSGDMDSKKIVLENSEIFKGAFFITSHLGNIEILRTMFKEEHNFRVNVFMDKNSCRVFNKFLSDIEKKVNIENFTVEDIDVETSMIISDKLKSGEIVFMAGDRISSTNETSCYETKFLYHNVRFPMGVLKFAQMLDVPIYFIICVKEKGKYVVKTELFSTQKANKSEILEDLKKQYVSFLEKQMLCYPQQYYNFYEL